MITRICSLVLTIALATAADAELRLAGGPFTLPAGTTGVETYSLEYTNDAGSSKQLFGFELLDYTLSVTPYAGSGAAIPTLNNNIVDVSTTFWTEFGGGAAPLGSIGWASPFGLTLAAGEATTIGTFDVAIPAGFLGEFILASADPAGIRVTSTSGAETGVRISPTSLTTVGGTPALSCDLDDDSDCDLADADILQQAIVTGASDLLYDIDGDGLITPADLNSFVTRFGGSDGTSIGDLNFSDAVDSTDLGLLLNGFGEITGVRYSNGDTNASGTVDSTDLGLLLNSFGEPVAAASVPEPDSLGVILIVIGGAIFGIRQRRQVTA